MAERQGGKLLVEHLRRLARGTVMPAAVHVQFRDVFPPGREAALLRLALRPFHDLARDRSAPFFRLSPRDCVILCDNLDPAEVVAASCLPERDPLIPMPTICPLIRGYDLALADDRLALMALARAYAEGEPRETEAAAGSEAKKVLDARSLGEINTKLKSTRIADLIQRQRAIEFTGGGSFQSHFEEIFVSIAALEKRLAPGTDMFGRPALFRYLTEILDYHVLRALASEALRFEHPISLNLNVKSIFSPSFSAMIAARDRTLPLFIEVPVSDLLANPAGFQRAATTVRDSGGHFGIDGVTPLMLSFLDIGSIAADFFKIDWHDAEAITTVSQRREAFAARIAALGPDRVIFCRVETLSALQSAIEFGVKRVQGHLIDRLVASQGVGGE